MLPGQVTIRGERKYQRAKHGGDFEETQARETYESFKRVFALYRLADMTTLNQLLLTVGKEVGYLDIPYVQKILWTIGNSSNRYMLTIEPVDSFLVPDSHILWLPQNISQPEFLITGIEPQSVFIHSSKPETFRHNGEFDFSGHLQDLNKTALYVPIESVLPRTEVAQIIPQAVLF